jgi:Family of unknown function (DUF5703)
MASTSSEYEIEKLRLPRTVSRRIVRQLLVDRAEHDGWELDRLRVYPDGQRVVTLKRRIIRARKTMSVPVRL